MGLNIGKLIKKIGSGIIKNVVPGGNLLVDAINLVLPGDKQLSKDATGDDLGAIAESLPPGQKLKLLAREFDVKIEEQKTLQAMLVAEGTAKHTTRPYIAKGAFQVIAFSIIIIIVIWSYAVINDKSVMVKAVMEGWPFILAITAPFSVILQAYFGVLRKENKDKMDAANGISQPTGFLGSVISKLIK